MKQPYTANVSSPKSTHYPTSICRSCCLVHTLHENIALKPAAASLRQGWAEARQGVTYLVDGLWDGIDAE